MDPMTSPSVRRHMRSLLGLLLSWMFITGLSAGTVPMKVDATNSTATIAAPKNSSRVVVEVKETKNGAWKVYKNLQIKTAPATVQVALPKGYQSKTWRASVGTATLPASKSKYPQKFFNGKKVFSASVASSYAAASPSRTAPVSSPVSSPVDMSPSTTVQATSTGAPVAMADSGVAPSGTLTVSSTKTVSSSQTTTTTAAVEADIWKVEGSTAYYFNQHRGLQVIDLSDPANPSLKAYYRLPAKGQDLYVLSSQGGESHVILITNETDGSTGVNLLKVKGAVVTPESSLSVQGWMADSRMVGNRLYLATQTWGQCWWYGNSDCVTSLNEVVADPSVGTLSSGKSFPVTGAWPVISAGGGWMAIATSDWNDWQTSKVTLFSLGDSGAVKTADAVSLYGRLYDKDHMGYESGRFSAVSERWVPSQESQDSWWWNGTRVTTLQNFSDDGTALASLEIQRGESLFATKFSGDKAYVVTARQVDPLFVVDLSDATNPVLSGQLEVPGRSTRIVPVSEDKLFTIGFDGNNKVCASLFSVADPANPSLLSRVSLGGTWGYSAATYDDKALKVLPEAGLVFIPYSSYSDSWVCQQYVQMLKLDVSAGSLALAGTITNRFDPLRATVVGETAVSISQKDLVTADISNPDAPTVLADLLLAWPVNRLLEAGSHLLQISDGSCWYGDGPGLVVSRAEDPDTVVGEVDLGDGSVKDASITGQTLRVLRQKDTNLILDLYGLGSLPALNLLGSATSTFSGNGWDVQVGAMLSPSSNCVVSVVQPNSRCWYGWGYPRIAIDPIVRPIAVSAPLATTSISLQSTSTATVKMAASPSVALTSASPESLSVSTDILVGFRNWWGSYGSRSQPASAVIFGVQDPVSPTALPSVTLTETNAGAVNVSQAGGGFLVVGFASDEAPSQWKRFRYCPLVFADDGTGSAVLSSTQGSDYGLLSKAKHRLRVLDLQDPTAPVLGPVQDLPGKLLAVSDLNRDGFLAWTEVCDTTRKVQVSAWNGPLLSQVSSVDVDFGAPVAVANRDIFAATAKDNGSVISRWSLSDAGALQSSGSISLSWMPSSIRTSVTPSSLALLGSDGVNLFSSLWKPTGPQESGTTSWKASLWFDSSRINPLSGGGIAVPEGDYGVEIFRP